MGSVLEGIWSTVWEKFVAPMIVSAVEIVEVTARSISR